MDHTIIQQDGESSDDTVKRARAWIRLNQNYGPDKAVSSENGRLVVRIPEKISKSLKA